MAQKRKSAASGKQSQTSAKKKGVKKPAPKRKAAAKQASSKKKASAKKSRSPAGTKAKSKSAHFSAQGGLAAASCLVSGSSRGTIPLFVVEQSHFEEWVESAPVALSGWLEASNFVPRSGATSLLPGDAGPLAALVVVRDLQSPWDYAALPKALPPVTFEVEPDLPEAAGEALALGWMLGSYRFERYKKKSTERARLVWPAECRKDRVLGLAEGTFFGRDLVNTPASDMGPAELAAEASRVAKLHGAKVQITEGDALLKKNYPMIHAVGRASTRAPRLVDFTWGKSSHPKLTLVGKGVCFDSGGLDMKPSQYMKLMKKDMGGAALVLGLAHAIMSYKLPVRLRVLVPSVENSVSGNAMRPLDVLDSRKGITVEVGNTDAEGRLILADALTEAVEEKPDLLIDAATLTGAARVAVGTGMPAVFATRDETWSQLQAGGGELDPVWRLPLHRAYRKKLESAVADISSTGDSYAGAITAALFLEEFVGEGQDWLHLDTMGFNLDVRPGRPRGGETLGLIALLNMLESRYG